MKGEAPVNEVLVSNESLVWLSSHFIFSSLNSKLNPQDCNGNWCSTSKGRGDGNWFCCTKRILYARDGALSDVRGRGHGTNSGLRLNGACPQSRQTIWWGSFPPYLCIDFSFSRLDFPPPVRAYHLLAKEVWWHEGQNEKKPAATAPSLACDGQIAAQTALLSRDRDNRWMASRMANTDPLVWRGNYGLLNKWLCSYHPKAQARRITAKEQALYLPCSIVLLQSAMVCQNYSPAWLQRRKVW